MSLLLAAEVFGVALVAGALGGVLAARALIQRTMKKFGVGS